MRLVEIPETRSATQIIEAAKELREKFRPTPRTLIFKPKPKASMPPVRYAVPDRVHFSRWTCVDDIHAPSIYLTFIAFLAKYAQIDIRLIQVVTALHFKISREDMISAARTPEIVWPRQVAMFIVKRITLRTLPEIGRRFGNRDHTTVLHAVRRVADLAANDDVIKAEVEGLISRIVEGMP